MPPSSDILHFGQKDKVTYQGVFESVPKYDSEFWIWEKGRERDGMKYEKAWINREKVINRGRLDALTWILRCIECSHF